MWLFAEQFLARKEEQRLKFLETRDQDEYLRVAEFD
jgi:hypothetical protein